jgi:hypothetical protein
MPRGSRPGERRGGRKKGIPNKKTALRNAALNAAAADPNFSPLDYLLNVMGEQAFPLETRVAAAREALPYFHSKLLASTERQATPGRYGDAFRGDKGGSAGQRSIHVRILKGGSEGAANGGDADTPRDKSGSNASAKHRSPHAVGTARDGTLTPLQFLLDVMRAPNTPAHFRLRIAAVVAPYVHFKRAADGPPRIVVEDPTGFSIDPARALELRDAKDRYDVVYRTRISQPEHWNREAAGLEARIAAIEKGLQCPCPSRYGEEQRNRDKDRLKELLRVRYSGLKLSMQEDIEEAWLTARVAAYSFEEDEIRFRIINLKAREDSRSEPLTLKEQNDLRILRALYPKKPIDEYDPSTRTFLRMMLVCSSSVSADQISD